MAHPDATLLAATATPFGLSRRPAARRGHIFVPWRPPGGLPLAVVPCRAAGPGASPHARLARQSEEWVGERRPEGAALNKYGKSNHLLCH